MGIRCLYPYQTAKLCSAAGYWLYASNRSQGTTAETSPTTSTWHSLSLVSTHKEPQLQHASASRPRAFMPPPSMHRILVPLPTIGCRPTAFLTSSFSPADKTILTFSKLPEQSKQQSDPQHSIVCSLALQSFSKRCKKSPPSMKSKFVLLVLRCTLCS